MKHVKNIGKEKSSNISAKSSSINEIIMHGNYKNKELFYATKLKDINYATKINAVFYVF